MRKVVPLALALILWGCDGKSPVEPVASPPHWQGVAVQRTVTATILNEAGAKVPGAVLSGYADQLPGVTWTLHAPDGDGTWGLYDGSWRWTVSAPGYRDLPVWMLVTPASTTFVYRLVQR